MRTWILTSAFLIAEAIAPKQVYDYDSTMSIFLTILFVFGFFIDIAEAWKRT